MVSPGNELDEHGGFMKTKKLIIAVMNSLQFNVLEHLKPSLKPETGWLLALNFWGFL
jgi:hypothetical protein